MKLDKGFTLIELLAVMLITSILISPYIYQKTVELKEERIRITLSELSDIATSAQNYAAEQSLKWPDEDNQCSSAITLMRSEGYLGSLSDSSIYDTSYSTSCTNSSGKRFFVEVVTQTAAQAEILASHLSSSEANGKSIYFSVPLPSSIPALEHLLPRDGSRPMTGDLEMGGNNIIDVSDVSANGQVEAQSVSTSKILDRDDPSFFVDPDKSSVMNNISVGVTKLSNSYIEGAACETKQIGTTDTGEFLSCVSGLWKKAGGGGEIGGINYIGFNKNYCLEKPVYVYAHKQSAGAALQGISIYVNGARVAISTGQSEGHMGWESVGVPISNKDCFRILDNGGGQSRLAWYREI